MAGERSRELIGLRVDEIFPNRPDIGADLERVLERPHDDPA